MLHVNVPVSAQHQQAPPAGLTASRQLEAELEAELEGMRLRFKLRASYLYLELHELAPHWKELLGTLTSDASNAASAEDPCRRSPCCHPEDPCLVKGSWPGCWRLDGSLVITFNVTCAIGIFAVPLMAIYSDTGWLSEHHGRPLAGDHSFVLYFMIVTGIFNVMVSVVGLLRILSRLTSAVAANQKLLLLLLGRPSPAGGGGGGDDVEEGRRLNLPLLP